MITNFWILQDNGLLLFHKCTNNNHLDNDLLAGFLSAIQMFINEMTNEKVKNIILNEKKFTYLVSRKNIFVILSHESDNNVIIESVLKIIQDSFFKKYEQYLLDYNNDVEIYEDFEIEFNEILATVDLTINCETCGKVILDNYLTNDIDQNSSFFCCKSCKQNYNQNQIQNDTNNSENYLICEICGEKVNFPIHCNNPMHIEKIKGKETFVCKMGQKCGVINIPIHCNIPMKVIERKKHSKNLFKMILKFRL